MTIFIHSLLVGKVKKNPHYVKLAASQILAKVVVDFSNVARLQLL